MKKFIFTFLLMLMPVMHVMGIVYYTYVDGLYYDFKSDGTAAVSSHIKYGRGEYSQDYSGDVVIPPTVTYNKRTYRVTSINEGAFSHCSDLNSVTIPNSITYIGYEAFYWHSLNSIYITDLAAWCNIKHEQSGLSYSHLFLNGEEVKDLIIPNGVTSISDGAFSCSGLTYVSIPNSVTTIGMHAFWKCTGLTSITIPNSVTSIGSLAFWYCSGLTTIKSEIEDPFEIDTNVFSSSDTDIYATATLIVPKGKKSAYNSTEGWKNFKYIVEEGEFVVDGIYYKVDENNTASVIKGNRTYSGDIVIPAYVNYDGKTYNVTSIDEYAFQSCSGLTSVTIPNSVTSIGDFAFIGCSGLTSLLIPSNVTSIGSCVFFSCSSLTSVTIPNSVTSIGGMAFSGCIGLTSVTIPNSVTSIGDYAFWNCIGLTSVTIPNSVTSIGDLAFWDCSGLTSVTIPNSVTYIGNSVFRNCSGLASVKVESGNIKYDSRNNCNAIIEKSSQTLIVGCKNTIIPNSVTSIGDYAFYGCNGLTSVTIPKSVTSIGLYAFENCSGLVSVKVESGNIKYDSRNDCNAIIEKSSQTLIAGCKNTIIPNGVTTIGEHAFSGCDGLTSVTIPNSVTSIGKGAFYGCNGLKTIVSKLGSPVNIIYRVVYKDGTAINEYSFSGETFANAVLYVTKGTKSLYEATEGWKKFTNIEEFVDGDVNLDEKVNRKDQNVLVAHIMGEKPEGFFDGLADLNGDNDVNAADVVKLVDILNNGGLSTEAEFGYDNVDGSLVVSSLTCTLNNERDEAILLTKCELYSNGSLLRSKSFSSNPVSVAAGGNKSCTFENLSKPANSTDFTVCWHYTVNDESFVYRCPLTD